MTVAADWRGAVGDVWAAEWRRTDRSFAELSAVLDQAILTAAPDGRGHVLDIGCGAGATSLALAAARPDLTVTGIDISADLIEVARDRAARAGLANARFATADLAGALPDLPPQDLLGSRHGVMFTADPRAMFADLHTLARPGATLIFSCFRGTEHNAWANDLVAAVTGRRPAAATGYAPGPFGFADPAFVRATLASAGWTAAEYRAVDYAYIAGAGADPVGDAASFFARIGPVASAINAAPAADRAALRDRLAAVLADHRTGDRVAFPASAWLWSATA